MTREEINQVCDLYAQGINELSKLTSREVYSEELAESLNAMLKSKEDGFNYTHNWIKQYVLDNSQTNDNGKELLYVAQKTAERTRKEVISKACEWLEGKNKMCMYELEMILGGNFIEDFRKAMEE